MKRSQAAGGGIRTLGEAFAVMGGGTPSTARPDWWTGSIPWVTSADLRDDLTIVPRKAVTEDAVRSSAATVVPRGSVIVATRVGLGKVGIAPCDMCFSQDCQALVLDDREWVPEFVAWQMKLRSHTFRHVSRGTTISGITKNQLLSLSLWAPPRARQAAVVADLEAALSRLDAGVAALKRAQANLRRYRASVLKAACEGRLVPTEAELARREGRDYETGAQLLERILAERRKAWTGKGKYKEPEPPDTTDLPELPEGWCWATVGQLATAPLCNGISVKGCDSPPGIRALRLSAMTDAGFDYADVRFLPLTEQAATGARVRSGDFFVARGNGSLHLVGRGTLAQEPPAPTIFPDTMIRVCLAASVDAWVARLWPSRGVRSQIERRVKTTAGIYKIAQPQVCSITVPLPPGREQERIVAEVARQLSLADQFAAMMTASVQRGAQFRQAVLQRAFGPCSGPPCSEAP